MTINTYDVGDKVQIEGQFADASGTGHDPTTVYVQFVNPAGVGIAYQFGLHADLVKLATGKYACQINAILAGRWRYRFSASGVGQSATENYFDVRPTYF